MLVQTPIVFVHEGPMIPFCGQREHAPPGLLAEKVVVSTFNVILFSTKLTLIELSMHCSELFTFIYMKLPSCSRQLTENVLIRSKTDIRLPRSGAAPRAQKFCWGPLLLISTPTPTLPRIVYFLPPGSSTN